jgi:hypothetical protein
MIIATSYPDDLEPGFLAWFVAMTLQGIASGCYPSFLRWQLPPLYSSGVRWALEPGHGSGREDFALPITTYRRQVGDCDDLTIWACCEWWQRAGLRPRQVLAAVAAGKAARPWVQWQGSELHALVWLPGNKLEDPSQILGG